MKAASFKLDDGAQPERIPKGCTRPSSRETSPAFSRAGSSSSSLDSKSPARSPSRSLSRSLTRQLSHSSISPVRTHRRISRCSDEFKAHHAVISKQLKNHNKWIINPRTNKWVLYWDGILSMCLLYTALVTPIEVCLFVETKFSVDGVIIPHFLYLFIFNRVVDSFFAIDCGLNFFLAYQEPMSAGGRWVTKLPRIRRHYLLSWFPVDFLSMIPFDLSLQVNLIDAGGQNATLLRLVRTVRFLRILKLLRILRGSRIIARWKSFIGISYASASMIRFFGATFFMIHLMACAWAYAGINWVPTTGVTLDSETSWIVYHNFTGLTTTRLYVISLYTAIVAMFGGVSLTPANYAEYCLYSMMMLCGSMVWAWVIGSLCGILATLNPHKTAFQNMMDELEYFMSDRNFELQHRVRLREFFRETQDYSRLRARDSLMIQMSTQLRGDTALKIGQHTLSRVSYFSLDHVEKEFMSVVALNLHGAIYEAREVLPTVDLTVVMKGMAARKLRIFSKGSILGADCVIPDARIGVRDLDTANCLTFLQTSQISRSALFTIVEHFPVAKLHMRKAAAIYTLRAAFMQYYKEWKSEAMHSFVKGTHAEFLATGGQRSFNFRQQTRMSIMRKGHRRQSANFSDILASIEQAKKLDAEGRGEERQNYNQSRVNLRVPRSGCGGIGVAGFGMGFGAGGLADDDDLGSALHTQILALTKGQEAEAKRSNDLIARNEALELRCGVLDDKLELIISLISRSALTSNGDNNACAGEEMSMGKSFCRSSAQSQALDIGTSFARGPRRGSIQALDAGTSFARGPRHVSNQANGCIQANGRTQLLDAFSSPSQVAPPPQQVSSAPGPARCRSGTTEVILPDGKVLHRRRKVQLAGAGIAVKAMRRVSCDAGHGGCSGTASSPPPPQHGDGTSGGVVGMLSAMAADAQPQQQPPPRPGIAFAPGTNGSLSKQPGLTRPPAVAFAAERQELKDALEA